jgi:stress-induced-phosphoprotein 1
MIQQNPAMADMVMQDPRMITALGVLMGIDIQGFSRPEGSDELPEGMQFRDTPATSSSGPKATPPPVPEAKIEEVVEEEDPDAAAKSEAEAQKKIGSEAYRQRNFEAAEAAFSKAWDLWPKDLTYLTNLSGELSRSHSYRSLSKNLHSRAV